MVSKYTSKFKHNYSMCKTVEYNRRYLLLQIHVHNYTNYSGMSK